MDDTSDVADIPIGVLFKRLKPAQFWTLLVTVAGLLVGSFTLGTKVTSFQLAKLKSECEDAENQVVQLRKKHDFFERYLRYVIVASENRGMVFDHPYSDEERRVKEHFVALVRDWYRNQDKTGANFKFVPGVQKSFDDRKSTVVFADRTEWPVPGEIKEAVLKSPE